ncbi:MAG: Ldh family oxidoreductase [Actinobacteria bacterium]|nr:Ldh family oxidoreductase [Actinomycetota bacterium]
MSNHADKSFDFKTLEILTSRVLQAMGAPINIADLTAESLVLSNLVGHDSHGIIRLSEYSGWVQSRNLIPDAEATIEWERDATAVIDGGWGFGQPASTLATEKSIEIARKYGTSTVVLKRTNHIGRLGEYVDEIATAGMMGIAFCNTGGAIVAPHGGVKAVLGTNPYAWATPGTDGHNFVLDFSTAVIAAGKVVLAGMSGEQIEPGALIDKEGKASTNPADLAGGGALLAFGGHKGSGLSVLIDVAAGAMSGNMPAAISQSGFGNGTVITAVDWSRFVDNGTFQSVAQQFATIMHQASALSGPKVLLPGELEAQTKARRLKEGVLITGGVQEGILEVADLYAVEIPEFH